MSAWSDWRPVEPRVCCPERVLGELLDGGQAFRWNPVDGAYRGVWGGCVAEIESRSDVLH